MSQSSGTALIPWSPRGAPRNWLPDLAGLLRRTAGRVRGRSAPQPQAQPALLVDLLAAESDDAAAALKAAKLLAAYAAADEAGRGTFFEALLAHGPDRSLLRRAALDFVRDPSDTQLSRLQALADPPRQGLIRRLNAAPGGTAALVSMRADLLRRLPARRELGLVDADFAHVFGSWFNRGFLDLRRITWATPAAVLEKLIRYEAVHAIQDWDDLRRRLDPPDRRCFAFFHPQLPDEPLIFVEVALAREMPGAIAPLLAADRTSIQVGQATTAVFYSISNCQAGLKGVAFGNLLIKQAVLELKGELPGLKAFCTLSPLPGFSAWLMREFTSDEAGSVLALADRQHLAGLASEVPTTKDIVPMRDALGRAAARYLLSAKGKDGKPADTVARFHLGNGARLERINHGADLSPRGLAQSAGVMVNYVYDPADIERNRAAFAGEGAVAASRRVRALAAGQ